MKRMRLYPLALFVAVLTVASIAIAYARLGGGLTRKWCEDIVAVQGVTTDLQHVRTRVVSDCTTERWYKGRIQLALRGCGSDALPSIWPDVTLHTVTTLNACGDGTTDGEVIYTYPAQNVVLKTRLIAVNHAEGDNQVLDGTLEGRSTGPANPPFIVRAMFHAVFAQDAEGVWQLTTLSANGILNPHDTPK